MTEHARDGRLNHVRKLPRKLICGVEHVRVPCRECGEPIWTARGDAHLLSRATCTACVPDLLDRIGRRAPAAGGPPRAGVRQED